jgi:hypothetical protein
VARPKRQYAVDDVAEDVDYDRALDYMNRTGRLPDKDTDYDDTSKPPRSVWAIAALVCGIIAMATPLESPFGILGILAIIFGHSARHEIKRGNASGLRMATWGLGLGYAFLALSFIISMSENY